MTQTQPDVLLSLGQAAKLLSVCPGRIYRYVVQGRITHDEWCRFKVSELLKLKPVIAEEDRKAREEST